MRHGSAGTRGDDHPMMGTAAGRARNQGIRSNESPDHHPDYRNEVAGEKARVESRRMRRGESDAIPDDAQRGNGHFTLQSNWT